MGTEVAVRIQAIGVGLDGTYRASPSSRVLKHTLSGLLEHWNNPVCAHAQPSLCGTFHGGSLGVRRPRRSPHSRYPLPRSATTRLIRSAPSQASNA